MVVFVVCAQAEVIHISRQYNIGLVLAWDPVDAAQGETDGSQKVTHGIVVAKR